MLWLTVSSLERGMRCRAHNYQAGYRLDMRKLSSLFVR